MSNVKFSSDHHAQHGNIILYANRPFLKPGDTLPEELLEFYLNPDDLKHSPSMVRFHD